MSSAASRPDAVAPALDASEAGREASRLSDERYAAHFEPQRTWPAFAGFCALCVGFVLLGTIPEVAKRLGVSTLELGVLMLFEVAAIGAATVCARYFGGVLGRAHRLAEQVETVVTAAVLCGLIYGSGSAVSFFWLLSVLHILHGAPDLHNSQVLRVAHGACFALLAVAFGVEGKLADTAVVVFFAAVVLTLSWAQGQSSRNHLAAQAERNLLRRRLEGLLVERERQRIARDLHDGLGGQLAALAWTADSLALERPGAEGELKDLAERARSGLAELRWLLTDLKSSGMSVAQLASSLQSGGARLVPPAVEYRVEHHGDAPLAPDVCYQLSLMTREATLNAVRHGGARRVSVSLALGESFTLSVQDDGCGFEPERVETSRGGLSHLRQRAEQLGGRLQLASSARGTHVTISLPLERIG